MSSALKFKRRPRGRGPERPRYAEAHIAALLAEWEPLHEIAATLPHWEPGQGTAGRPPLFPPAMVLLFGAMRWGDWKSERSVERQLSHQETWEPIRRSMHARYPDYRGLQPGAKPMTRHHFRRYRDTVLSDDVVFEHLLGAFREEAAKLALEMGMFDPAKFSPTHPDPTTMLAGDNTVLKSRFDAAPGATHVDPDTGEIINRLFDPDAAWYEAINDQGKTEKVYGTKFGILQGRIPGYEHERVVVDVVLTTTGDNSEAKCMERAVERFQQLAPGITGIVYDMALRGVNREHFTTWVSTPLRGHPSLRVSHESSTLGCCP